MLPPLLHIMGVSDCGGYNGLYTSEVEKIGYGRYFDNKWKIRDTWWVDAMEGIYTQIITIEDGILEGDLGSQNIIVDQLDAPPPPLMLEITSETAAWMVLVFSHMPCHAGEKKKEKTTAGP